MNNFTFLQNIQTLQYGIMFDFLEKLDFGTFNYCRTYTSVFWNSLLTDKVLNNTELSITEKVMKSYDRNPAIYFENKAELTGLKDFLLQNSYQKAFEDSWMFYSNMNIPKEGFDMVRVVSNTEELEAFLATFNACYEKNDPQNPYGELGDYISVARESWLKHEKYPQRLMYILAYKNSIPVAVSSLTNHNNIGYISNVGSLRKVRGEGFGKLATLYAIYLSQQLGNQYHCLATEEGQYPNNFYKRIGFETKFTAHCFNKEVTIT